MKNFKRILAIVLVVMMVVPMMTTGLSAATAESLQGQFSAGVTFAGGNWKAFSYNDWSEQYGVAAFDDLSTYNVDAEGQITLYNAIQKDLNGYATYGWINRNPINVLQSTNTTAIDGLYFRNGMPNHIGTASSGYVFAEQVSYAFSENQLVGTLSPDVFTKDAGFAVADGMVSDGLVVTLVNTDGDITSNGAVFNTITAYVMDGGQIVSSQSFTTDNQGMAFGLCVAHAHNTFWSFTDGVLTYHVEDNYSADGLYINQTYVFDELDTSTLSTYKDYYLCVGSKGQGDEVTGDVDGSVSLNLARISEFSINAEDGTYDAVNSDNKNVADWTGYGVVNCAHEIWSDWTVTLEPTCDTTGTQEHTCQSCGKTEVETIAALGHTWGDWTITTEATCTEAGAQERTCSVCGDVETATIAALGHSWGDWYVTVEPTCTDEGMQMRECTTCGSYEEAVIAATGHAWVWDVLPTATQNGQRTCATCAAVESDLAYDLSYYWTTAAKNPVGNLNENFATYNDNYTAQANDDGSISMLDMSITFDGAYCYNPMLKMISEFKSDLLGFYATVDTIETNNIETSLENEYPTTVSFIWTNKHDQYDDAVEYSTYCNLSALGVGNTDAASRYGFIWGTYTAGEYTLVCTLSDYCTFWAGTVYGTPDDGVYEYLYYTAVSNGNYWTTQMPAISVNAFEPINVAVYQEKNVTTGNFDIYFELNGELITLDKISNSMLQTTDYYFGVATYGEGANKATSSFELADVCGQQPAYFNGYTHECDFYGEVAATCTTDGYTYCPYCGAVDQILPATGHNYVDFVCTVCGELEGKAVINNEVAYPTFTDAIAAAQAGDTIKLLAHATGDISYTIPAQKNITIDLNGYNIRNKSGSALFVDSANVTIVSDNEGTIRSSDGYSITVTNSGNVSIVSPIIVRCSTSSDITTEFGLLNLEEGSTVYIAALGGRYYMDPVACGATLAEGLAVSGSGNNYTIVEAVVECTHQYDAVVTPPTCTEDGYTTYTCLLCGEGYVSDHVLATGHTWGDWVVTVEPQVGVEGSQTRTCDICGATETETIPALEEETKDWVITFDPAEGTMPEGVDLSYGINTNENYKEATGIDYPVPTLDGYVFVGWYWEAYNYTLDEGTWNGGYFAVAQNVDLVALYEEAPEVAVVADGNTINVTNIDDSIKDIWVAEGEANTYTAVKAAKLYMIPGTSAKVVNGAWAYDVAENGIYTVMIRYNDGTVETKYIVVECNDGQVPDVVQDGATITFNNLENIYVLRYVEGTYDNSYDIKRAEGVTNIQHGTKYIVNNSFSVTLEPGTYSFVTQFYDGNYVYYNITVEAPVPTYPERAYTITFDPCGGEMPAGTVTELPIDYQQNYKEAAGYDYPVPTMEGATFAGWYLEAYNFTLTEGDWNGGYYALASDCELIALWEEA